MLSMPLRAQCTVCVQFDKPWGGRDYAERGISQKNANRIQQRGRIEPKWNKSILTAE